MIIEAIYFNELQSGFLWENLEKKNFFFFCI